MNDDWIDKNEMNQLISGINPNLPQQQRAASGPVYNDIFYDIQPNQAPLPPVQQNPPHSPYPPQQATVPAQTHQAQAYPPQLPVNQPQPYQAHIPQPSPFTLDEESTDPAERIAQLEIMLAELKQTQPPAPVETEAEAIPTEAAEEENFEDEPVEPEIPCNDRIPLDVEIDRYLSLKGRLGSLAEILQEHLQMEQMMVVDQNGLSLFETRTTNAIEGKVDQYLQKMRDVYAVDIDNYRNHSGSQLATEDGKWLLLLPTDGKGIERKYTLKCLLPTPLDPPEIYTLIELLNDSMRPAKKD